MDSKKNRVATTVRLVLRLEVRRRAFGKGQAAAT